MASRSASAKQLTALEFCSRIKKSAISAVTEETYVRSGRGYSRTGERQQHGEMAAVAAGGDLRSGLSVLARRLARTRLDPSRAPGGDRQGTQRFDRTHAGRRGGSGNSRAAGGHHQEGVGTARGTTAGSAARGRSP